MDEEDLLLSKAEIAEKKRLKEIRNVYKGSVIGDDRLPTRIRHLLSIHVIGDADRLLKIKADDFMALWGLGWSSWKEVVQYKWLRCEEDGIDYFKNDGSKFKWEVFKDG